MEQTVRKARATFDGIVISDKNDKTITVLVETYKRHKIYGKRVKYRKKYYAHDEENVAKEGDFVRIMATRPKSALKRWRLVKVLELAEVQLEDIIDEEGELIEELKEASDDSR